MGSEQPVRHVAREGNPLLVRRGGCAMKKMARSLLSGADGVVAHDEHSV
jgi:hypothetical protein